MAKEEREPESADEVDSVLDEVYGELLDVNRELLQRSRTAVNGILEIKDMYLDQAARCDEIAELHIRGAQITASAIGDVLSNEWGVVSQGVDSDGDEEEGAA